MQTLQIFQHASFLFAELCLDYARGKLKLSETRCFGDDIHAFLCEHILKATKGLPPWEPEYGRAVVIARASEVLENCDLEFFMGVVGPALVAKYGD